MFRKIKGVFDTFGPIVGSLYGLHRILARTGGGVGLYLYEFVAQPVAEKPLLPSHRGRSIVVRRVDPRASLFHALELSDEVLAYRAALDTVAFAAFKDDAPIGCLWVCLGPYLEDEVRCQFFPEPAKKTVWDFGIYLLPEHRNGLAFARLWDAANAFLRKIGAQWTLSRISAFNTASLQSHRRLGTVRLGRAAFLRLGKVQIMVSGLRPRFHLSFTYRAVPCLHLVAPPGRKGAEEPSISGVSRLSPRAPRADS